MKPTPERRRQSFDRIKRDVAWAYRLRDGGWPVYIMEPVNRILPLRPDAATKSGIADPPREVGT